MTGPYTSAERCTSCVEVEEPRVGERLHTWIVCRDRQIELSAEIKETSSGRPARNQIHS